MPDVLVRSFAPLLLAFQPCFTRPSFSSFWALACGWILCSGRRSLTRIIQSAQLGDFKHYCSFHRFLSQPRWNLDDMGHCVFQLLLPFCAEILIGAVDDTLARKSGRHIWGADQKRRRQPNLSPDKPAHAASPVVRIMILSVPPRNDLSSPSAIAGWCFPCTSLFPSRPGRSGLYPSSSGSIASGRPRNSLPAARENWKGNKPGKPRKSNIEPVPNWLWK